MRPAPRPAAALEQGQRQRFEALRIRIFEEMGVATARWRLTWFLLFNVVVLTLLVVRGESGPRAFIQGLATAVLGTHFAAQLRSRSLVLKVLSFLVGAASYFALLATTGGLASPLLMTGLVMINAASIVLRNPPWLRRTVFITFMLCFVVLAALSRTTVGHLAAPLEPVGGSASREYVTLTLLAAMFTVMATYRMGCMMTRGYERVALELAERREELCTENEDRTRALQEMAARLAHEVKNPLAAIKGLSTHMARNAADAKSAERLAIVAAEADRLQSIVDGFLSFSRGLEDLKVAPTRVHDVARELSVLLETRAQDAGVSLTVSGDADLVVDADVRKLRQALLNVVLNAIQASSPGEAVVITTARGCEGGRITVRDQGAGMTPEVLERIRKPYFTTKAGGSGLGVAVARGLVEQHGGRLEFKSAPGAGTTVSLHLPVKATPCMRLPNPLRAPNADPAEHDGHDGARARLMTT